MGNLYLHDFTNLWSLMEKIFRSFTEVKVVKPQSENKQLQVKVIPEEINGSLAAKYFNRLPESKSTH